MATGSLSRPAGVLARLGYPRLSADDGKDISLRRGADRRAGRVRALRQAREGRGDRLAPHLARVRRPLLRVRGPRVPRGPAQGAARVVLLLLGYFGPTLYYIVAIAEDGQTVCKMMSDVAVRQDSNEDDSVGYFRAFLRALIPPFLWLLLVPGLSTCSGRSGTASVRRCTTRSRARWSSRHSLPHGPPSRTGRVDVRRGTGRGVAKQASRALARRAHPARAWVFQPKPPSASRSPGARSSSSRSSRHNGSRATRTLRACGVVASSVSCAGAAPPSCPSRGAGPCLYRPETPVANAVN